MKDKLVIFDCDGTLVDSQHIIVASMSRTFAAHGRPAPSREAILSIVGLSLPQAIGKLVGADDNAPVAAMVQSYKDEFHVVRAGESGMEPLYDGTLDCLNALKADGVTLAIATGKSQRGVRLVMGHHGIYGDFASIQTADDAPSKPDPTMIHQALAETGKPPGDAVMVGDTTYDIEMALNAGVTPIAVTWGYHSVEQLREAGATHVIEHFDQLIPLLKRLWGEA